MPALFSILIVDVLPSIEATRPSPLLSVPATQIPMAPVFRTIESLIRAWSPRVRIPTPPGGSAVVVVVPTARSTRTPVIEAFLEVMSKPAVLARKQRRFMMASRTLLPSSFTHQSKNSMPLLPPVLPPMMVTSTALLTRMPTLPSAVTPRS